MIDAKTVKEVATKYIYDRCPAVVGVGKICICSIVLFVYKRTAKKKDSHSSFCLISIIDSKFVTAFDFFIME